MLVGCVETAPPEKLEIEGETDGETATATDDGVPLGPGLVDPNLQACEHCDDGNACTVGLCHPETGQCFFQPRVCDDGLACTEDSCDPDSGCVFDPVDSACVAGQDCVTATACSLDAPEPMPGGNWAAVQGDPGCWFFLDDGWCADDDGCACNGAETCDPWHASLPGGCVPAPRPQWPCEDDDNACTEENCCEPWDPEGCRVHAEILAATPEGQEPALEQFCDNAGEKEAVDGPAGPVECVTGELKYRVNVPDAILDDFAPDKDEGYWCNDCRPCSLDECDEATGACDYPDRATGPFYGDDPEKMMNALGEVCPEPEQRVCFGDASFGCGQFSCVRGVCAAPAHPDNDDPAVSDLCHGFPVREVSTEDADDVVPAETCFEVGCVDVTKSEAGETVPWFQCVAMPHDELCASNDLCSEAVCDGVDLCPGGCTPTQLGNFLMVESTSRRDTPPVPGAVVLGCSQSDPALACDDGIECTFDTCDPVLGCVHGLDDRSCPNTGGAEWQPCDYDAYCSEEGCLVQGDDPCAETGDGLDCALECIETEGARTCMGYDECGPGTCFTEGFLTLELEPIVDQCPWLPGFIPNPGDSDFDGNGPLVNVAVTLSISPDQHSIYAWVDFEARETKSDFSTLQVPLPPVAVATTGVTIVDILSERTGTARGLATSDLGGFVDFTTVTGVVDGASVRGDTLYGDISDDPDCHDDTWIEKIDLRSVEVSYRQDCALE